MSTHKNRRSPKKRGYWLSPAEIATQIPTSMNGCVCYELGATGSIHAGSLRALHFAEQVQREAAKNGKNIEFILRLNDLVPAKFDRDDYEASSKPGYPIAAEICGNDGQTLLGRLQNELRILYSRIGWRAPRILKVSEIYGSDRFTSYLDSVLGDSDAIAQRLSKFKSSPVSFYSPICPHCRRVRSAQSIREECDKIQFECGACNGVFEFWPGKSLGLVTFKLEQALIWQFCSTVVDVHGQDHIEAFDASCELARDLELEFRPLAGRVNLVLNQNGEKLSKSRRNFKPVAELTNSALHELIGAYERTPYWRPIKLE